MCGRQHRCSSDTTCCWMQHHHGSVSCPQLLWTCATVAHVCAMLAAAIIMIVSAVEVPVTSQAATRLASDGCAAALCLCCLLDLRLPDALPPSCSCKPAAATSPASSSDESASACALPIHTRTGWWASCSAAAGTAAPPCRKQQADITGIINMRGIHVLLCSRQNEVHMHVSQEALA
jgi:hypothetical protein